MTHLPRNTRRIAGPATTALLAALSLPAAGVAQSATPGWPSLSGGIHVGYDQNIRGTVAGAHVRAPAIPNGKLEILSSGDVTFLSGLREFQGTLDAVFASGGRRGGLYGGAGLVLRNTVFDVAAPRETRQGWGVVLGLASGPGGPFVTQVEFRWAFLPDTELDPRLFSVGVTFPLLGGQQARR